MRREPISNPFGVEELEPRVMLSADFSALAGGAAFAASNHLRPLHEASLASPAVQPAEGALTNHSASPSGDIFAGLQQAPLATDSGAEKHDAAAVKQQESAVQVQPSVPVGTQNTPSSATTDTTSTLAATTVNSGSLKALELTKTLRSANSPPLAQDLQGYISDLLASSTASFSSTQQLGAVSLGGMLELDGVQLTVNATLTQGSWSGSVSIAASSATLFPGKNFSAAITSTTSAAAVTGTYTIGATGTYSLTVPTTATMVLKVGEALAVTATGFNFAYDPNGTATQTLATLSNASVTSPQFSGMGTATLGHFALRSDGFSFDNFTLTSTTAGISNIITAASATLTVSAFNVTFGYGTTPAAITQGTVGLSLSGVQLFPAGGLVQFQSTGVTAAYNFAGFDGTSPTGQLTLTVSGFKLSLGQALQLTTGGTDVVLTPGQTVMATIASATLTSPQFSGLGSLQVTALSISQTGFSLGSATWSSTGQVSIGSIVQAGSVTLTLSNLGLQYGSSPAITGSISVSATNVILFPSVPLLNLHLGSLAGSYTFGDSLNPTAYLLLKIPSLDIALGDALTIHLGAVNLTPGQATMVHVTSATVTANLFAGLPTFALGTFDLTQTGFTLGSFTISTTSAVTIGNFLSAASLTLEVSGFALDTTKTPVVSGTVRVTLGTLTLFPGTTLVTSTFTNVQGIYAFGSSTAPGQFSLTADAITLSVASQLSISAQTITLTPGLSTLATIGTATLVFAPLDGLSMTITGLQIQQTGFSIATGTATFANPLSLGSILTLQAPTVTLTNVDYVFGGALSGTVGFASAGASLQLGSALTTTASQLTGSYDLATGKLSASLGSFGLGLAGFATFSASGASITYSPATDGTAEILVGVTGLEAFVGTGTGSSRVGIELTGGTLALAVFKASGGALTYALDATGSAALLGMPDNTLSVSAGNLEIRANTAGAVSATVSVNGTPLQLSFTGNQQAAFAKGLSVSVGTFVSVVGDFGFSQFTSGSQTYLSIGATNVNATMAAGGVSVTVVGASLGLLVQPGATAAQTTYALVANGGTDSLNGVTGVTLTASGLIVRVRNGLDVSSVGTISQVQTPGGNVSLDFTSLGSGSTSVTDLEGTITLAIANFVSIRGSFGFQQFTDNGSTFLAVGGSGLTVVLGTATTNLTVANASFGLIIEPGTGSNPATYALEAKGSASAADTSLNGVPGITLNGSSIVVRVRQGLDVTGDTHVPTSVQTPGGPVTLDFAGLGTGTTALTDIEGNLTLAVAGFGSVQGSFGFQSFTDGKTGQSEWAIGATGVTVTLGTSATNLTVTGGALSLIVRPGVGSAATTYALTATASSASLNGASDLNVSATNVLVRIRSGLDLATASALPTTIHTSGGDLTLDFSGLPSGSSNLIDVEASLTLSVGSFVTLSGNFGFQSYAVGTDNYLEVGGTGISVTLAAGGVSFTLANATLGVVVKQGSPGGYAVEVIGSSNPADTALTGVPGLTVNAKNLLVLARNGLDATALLSTLPKSIHTSGGDVALAFAGLGSGTSAFTEIQGQLTLNVAGFVSLQGSFGIESFADGTATDLAIAAQNVTAVLGTSSLNVTIAGASLALLIKPGTGYDLVATGGTDSLNGVPDLSLSASGLTVRIRSGLDPSSVTGAPSSIPLSGNGSGGLSFTGLGSSDITEIYGHITVNVANIVSLTGDFSFTETTVGTLTTILVGASNVSAFVGAADGSFGVKITGASLGLVIYRDSAAANSTYALQATAPSITAVGLPSDITLSGSASVLINTTGAKVNTTIPGGGPTINLTDGTNNTADQRNIRMFGGSLTLDIGSVFTITGDFSFTSKVNGSVTELLVGAANVKTAVGTNVTADSGASFTLSKGTLGLVLFENGTTAAGYALTASATATASGGTAVSGSATLTVRRNTTTSAQNITVTVGSTVIPVVFSGTEIATGTPPTLAPFKSITVGDASLSIGNTILITAGSADAPSPTPGASSKVLTSVSILLENPTTSQVLFQITATSANYTTFSAAVSAATASGVSLPTRVDGSGWAAGDEDLVLTNVAFSIGSFVSFSAQKIDLQHFTSGTVTTDSFNFTGATITFYAGSSPMVTLAGSPRFHFNTTDGFKLDSFTSPSFSFMGQSVAGLGSAGGALHAEDLSARSNSHTLGPLTLVDPSVGLSNFQFGFGSGTTANLTATVTISVGSATIGVAGSPASATVTNLSGSFDVTLGIDLTNLTGVPTGSANGFSLKADNFTLNIGSFLTLSAGTHDSPLTFDPTAGPTQDLINFGSLSATLHAGSLSITGTASNFAIEGNGSFLAKTNFGVSLSLGTNPDGSLNTGGTGLPSWLPLQSATIAVNWPNFNSDPSRFTLTISAQISLTQFNGLPLSVSGGVTDLVIDPSLISQSKFPIISIGSFNVKVSGNLFGGKVDGQLIIGIVRFDSTGAVVDGLGNLVGTTTPGQPGFTSAFFAGIEAGFSMGGMSGFDIKIGLSDYGPLQIYVDVGAPVPIGDTGLFLTNFRGGITFGATFPTLTLHNPPQAADALQLNGAAFTAPESLTSAQWEAQLASQVAHLVQASTTLPTNPWANFLNQPMIIQAGMTLYAGTQDAFRIDGDIFFDTSGKILAIGSATFGDSLTVQVKVFADLSSLMSASSTAQSTTKVDILFLMQVPAPGGPSLPPIYQIYGDVSFSYNSATKVFQMSIAGEADFNLANGLEAQVAATLSLTFTSNSFNITLSSATFTIPQIQATPLGTAAGTLTVQTENGTTNVWGGFLLTPTLSGLESAGIFATGQVFIKLNTTSQTKQVTLTNGTLTLSPQSFSLFVNGGAIFKINNQQVFQVSGTLDLEIANGSLTIFVQAQLLMGPDSTHPILTFNANGLIFVQMVATTNIPIGFAAKIALTQGGTVPNGIVFGENWLLVMNTTGVDITYFIPVPVATSPPTPGVPTVMGPDYSSSNPLALTSYETTVNGQRALVIPNGPPHAGQTSYATWTPTSVNTPYLIVLGRGTLTVANTFTLSGNLNIVATLGSSGFNFSLDANATLALKANGNTVFTFQANGGLQLSNAGIAAALNVSLSGGVPGNLGFTLKNASFLLELNTTGQQQTIGTTTVSAGTGGLFAEVHITGDLTLLGGIVDFFGSFDVTITGGSLTIALNANITFLGATFVANGFAGIYYDSHPGFALYIQLSLPGGAEGIAPVAALGSNFVIKGTFTLSLNTSSITRNGIAPGFSVAVTNLGVYLFGFNLTGSLSISITNAGFGINIQNLDLNLFGIVDISLSGYYNPNGSFSFTGTAGFQIGDHTFGVGGTISVTISNSGFSASVSGWVAAFGGEVDAGGSITISGGSVDIYIFVTVTLVPAIHIHTPAVTVDVPWWLGGGSVTIWPAIDIDTPAVTVSGTAHFHLGSTAPAPVVAQVIPPPPPPTPPALAGVNNGVLTLYLGSDVASRVNSANTPTPAQPSENYTLTRVSGDPNSTGSGETILVSALGFQETFTNVTSIKVSNTLDGNDTISIDSAIATSVNMTLGSGNNTVTAGSGAATISVSGAGTNSVGTGNNSSITVSGGGSNHVTTGSGSTVVISGSGSNSVTTNGGSNPVTISGNGNNTVTVNNGGSETISISGTGYNNVNVTGGSPTINVQASASGSNQISVNTGSSSTVTIAGNGGNQLTMIGSGSPTITVTGNGSNQITTGAGSVSVKLQGGGSNTVNAGGGFATINDQGTGATTVTGGTGGGVFIGGLTSGGSAFTTKGGSSLSTKYGNFTVQLSGYSSYSLSDSYLSYGSFTLSLGGIHQVTLTAGSSSTANTISLVGWTGSATLNGTGSNNTVLSAPSASVSSLNYVLSNNKIQITGGITQTITLSNIQNAQLIGANTGTNTFDISAWTGGGFLAGPKGTSNSVTATDDIASFTLSDNALARSGYGTMSLNGIQSAILTGGAGANTFNVGTTGNWSGNATLDGKGGNDTYNVTLTGTNTGTITVADSGPTASDTLNISGVRNFFITASQVREGTQRVNYSGVAILNLLGTVDGLGYYAQSTHSGVSTSVKTGGAASLVDVGSTAGNVPTAAGVLSGIQGTLSVSGGGQLLVDNTGSFSAQSGTLTPTSITGFGMGSGGIQYQGVSTLTINLGSGANTVAINDITSTTRTIVNAGASGSDQVNVTFAGDFNGELDLTGFEHGTVAVAGNFNGTLNDTGPGHLESVAVGQIASHAGSLAASGKLTVSSIDSMSVGLDLAGTVSVSGTLGSLTVGGAVSGSVTETGVIATLSVGSLSGIITASNGGDPAQFSPNSLGDITSATVGGALAGTLFVSGNVGSLSVGGNLSGTVTLQGALTTLQVTGDVSGSVTESGAISLLTIGGNLAATGKITAVNATPAAGAIATFNIGQSLAGIVQVSGALTKLSVTGDISGKVTESGVIDSLTIGGSLASTGVITVFNGADPVQVPVAPQTTFGNINTMTVDHSLAGSLLVTGSVTTLNVGSGSADVLSGTVTVQNNLTTLSVNGDVTGSVFETGAVNSLTITGSLAATGIITAKNTNDSPWVPLTGTGTTIASIALLNVGQNVAGKLSVTGNVVAFTVGGGVSGTVLILNTLTTFQVGGDVSGTVTESGSINLLTIGGSLTGTINAINTQDSSQVPLSSQITLANINTMTVGHNLSGLLTVTGNVGSLTVGTTSADSLSGNVTVGNTLTNLVVTGDVSGHVTESGTVTLIQIGGSLTAGGTITATNEPNDSLQVPVTPTPTLANVITMTVGHSLAGSLLVTGSVTTLNVGSGSADVLSGTVTVQNNLTTLSVNGDVTGSVFETGAVNSLTITGSLAATGKITAKNTNDSPQVPQTGTNTTIASIALLSIGQNVAGKLSVTGNVVTFTVGGSVSGTVLVQGTLTTLKVGGDVSGTVTESGTVNLLTIGGSLTGSITAKNTQDSAQVPLSGQITVANINTMTVGHNLSGLLTVTGNIGSLTVGTTSADSLSGNVTVGNTLTNLVVTGDVSGHVTESGTVTLIQIGGSLTAGGTITATNEPNDSLQVPVTPTPTLANVITMTVGHSLAGSLLVTGSVTTLNVGSGSADVLSGTVTVQNNLTTLSVNGDVTGSVFETGAVNLLTITGSLSATGIITAKNTNDSPQVPQTGTNTTIASIALLSIGQNVAGKVSVTGNVVTFTVGGSVSGTVLVQGTLTTLKVGGDVSGTVTESGTVNLLTIGGSLTGSVTAKNTQDSGQVPLSGQITLANINTMTVGHSLSGVLTVTGNLGTVADNKGGMTVGTTAGDSLSGKVVVGNTLTNLAVSGDVSGSVQESGTITSIAIGGSLTAAGSIAAANTNDSAQYVTSGQIAIASITTMTVTHSLAGILSVTGNLGTLKVGSGAADALSGLVTVQGTLTTLVVSGDVSGAVYETGTINLLTISGSLTKTGTQILGGKTVTTGLISAWNTNLPLGNIVTLTIGKDLAGTILISGNLHSLAITGGQMTPTGVLTVGSLDTMTIGPDQLSVGQNMAGTITVVGTLQTLRVAGGTPGTISAGHIGTISVYGGFGPVVLDVTEAGIERLVTATTPSANPYPRPDHSTTASTMSGSNAYVNFQFYYESSGLANPQLTARVTNGVGTARDQYDLSLLTYNDAAKFNLARLDAAGVSGVRNVTVEGDLLTSVSARAAAFFKIAGTAGATIQDPTPAGVRLASDDIAGVSIRDFAPDGYIQVRSIQAIAFGSFRDDDGIQPGAQASQDDAEELLAPGTKIVPAADTFRVAFADLSTQQVALFIANDDDGGRFGDNSIVFTVQSVVTANAAGTANIVSPSNVARGAATALVTVLPTHSDDGQLDDSGLQTIAINGDGASIQTQQWISQSITSTGPLGDLILEANQGITNVTAPSIFGSIISGGGITGTIQTTGLRTDPITGAVTSVSADIGRAYVTTSGGGDRDNVPYLTATVIQAEESGISGRIISRGNLVSEITSDGGIIGLIAVQGNLGANWLVAGKNVRLGGMISDGTLGGSVVILGQQLGDVTINGGLNSGNYAVKGGISGNLEIDGSIDGSSVVVSGGKIGDATQGTALTANGDNKGIIAAAGTILYGKRAPKGHFFNNLGANPASPSAVALNSIFTPLQLDQSGLDLQGLQLILVSLDNLGVNSAGNLVVTTPAAVPVSSISNNFNGSTIAAGNTIWFSSSVQVQGFNNAPGVQLFFSNSTITFTVPGSSTPVKLNVPGAVITFDLNTTVAATSYNAAQNVWQTIVPANYTGNVFLSGVAYQVPSNTPGNLKNVTWSGAFTSNTAGLQAGWQWGAAVYTGFSANMNALGVKPVDDSRSGDNNKNGNPAGTPANYTSLLAKSSGGTNYSWFGGGQAEFSLKDFLVHP